MRDWCDVRAAQRLVEFMSGCIWGFLCDVLAVHAICAGNEVAAVDEILEALGREDDVGNADGDGDLLDDFVLTAAAKVRYVHAPNRDWRRNNRCRMQ